MHSRASKAKKKHHSDPILSAKSLMEKVTGEKWETRVKNPAAVALSKLGASKGGIARAASLTAKQRSKIAKKAAKKRWAKVA
jgi:hypothetical protein